MTTYAAYRLLLIGLGVLTIPFGIAGLRPLEVQLGPAGTATAVAAESIGAGSLDSFALAVVDHDPFRLSRSPAAIPYSAEPPEAVYVEPPPAKPQLVLTGIVWGDEPSAIVEGLPGMEAARSLRTGDSGGGIRVRQITQSDATLIGMDTTWVLQVRKPW